MVLALFVLLAVVDVGYVLASRGLGPPAKGLAGPDALDVSQVFGALASGTVGLFLAWTRPRNVVGWLVLASGLLLALCNLGQAYGEHSVAFPGDHLPGGVWVMALSAPLWVLALFIPPTLLLVRYPSGAVSGWPRRFEKAVLVAMGLTYLGYALAPDAVADELTGRTLPWPTPDWVAATILVTGGVILLVGALLIVLDAIRRTLWGPAQERQALLLLLTTSVTSLLVVFFADGTLLGMIVYLSVLLAIAVGVMRYGVLGIDVVVQRTVVYLILTGLVLAGFVGIVTGLATVLPRGPAPQIVAAAAIAVGLGPARQRVQAAIDRLLYGDRDDPFAAIQRFGTPMGGADVEEIVPGVMAALAAALRLEVVTIDGPPGDLSVPLVFGGQDLGVLNVGPRRGQKELGRADRRLVESVAPLIASVVYAVRLAGDLQRERERVIDATMAERRRFRADLHDGLGPSLTGIGLGLDAAHRNGASDELLVRLREEVASSLQDVRRIIEDLAPSALESQDLLSALRQRAAQITSAGAVAVDLVAPTSLPWLSPSVSAAAYRITDEALTNVVRHSGAGQCRVVVRVADDLQLEVTDDGVGPGSGRGSGIGLRSMRERAEKLGGSFSLKSGDPGTRVCVHLPLVGVT